MWYTLVQKHRMDKVDKDMEIQEKEGKAPIWGGVQKDPLLELVQNGELCLAEAFNEGPVDERGEFNQVYGLETPQQLTQFLMENNLKLSKNSEGWETGS